MFKIVYILAIVMRYILIQYKIRLRAINFYIACFTRESDKAISAKNNSVTKFAIIRFICKKFRIFLIIFISIFATKHVFKLFHVYSIFVWKIIQYIRHPTLLFSNNPIRQRNAILNIWIFCARREIVQLMHWRVY